ncbi:MAG: two-component regulator propeller domain-containing protein [Bryobacteraceae bacterium]
MRRGLHALLAALAIAAPGLCLDPSRRLWHYGITHWQDPDGLPRNTVHAVAQTADGYIWVGTEGGLARFNGRQFRVFGRTTDPAIPNNGILSLAASSDGGLWVGTRSGLVRYQGGRFERVDSGLWPAEMGIRQLTEDAERALWAATGAGLARFKDGVWFQLYTEAAGVKPGSVRSFSVRGADVWIGSTTGLDLFRGRRRVPQPHGVPADTVRAVLPDRAGRVWVGTENRGLYLIERGNVRRMGPSEGFPGISVRTMLEDRDGNVWIGTVGNGLCRFNGSRFDWLSTKEGFASDHIRALFEDREGNLWVATEAGGVSRLRNGRVRTLTTLDGLGSDFIRAIAGGKGGRLFAGTEGAGLYEHVDGRFVPIRRLGLPKAFVTSILEDRQGNLWVGTEGEGAFQLTRSGRKSYSSATGIPENSAWAIQEDKLGNVWIATSNGLLRVHGEKTELLRTPQGLRENALRGLHSARDGSLWISLRSWGLQRLKGGRFEAVQLPSEARYATVTSFHEDAAGDLWMTTNAGLVVWSRGVSRLVTSEKGLAGEYLCQVVEDAGERLWISGSRGIFVAPKKEFIEAAMGRTSAPKGVTLTSADGMKSSECSGDAQPCGVRADNGDLWFSTIRGVVRIPSGEPTINALPPPVVIERVEVNGQPAPTASRVVSPPGNRLLKIEFAALTFRAPEKVQYRYRLDGVDQDWVAVKERGEALYHNVPPGTHRFLLMAANEDGVWSTKVSEIEIEVEPYFYQRPWFFGLCAAALGLSAFGAHGLRTRTVRREFAAVLSERTRIAREIHDTLLQGFAGSALQLNALLRKLRREPEAAGRDLERVLDQIDSCLAEARREIVELRGDEGEAGAFGDRLRSAVGAAAGSVLRVECVFKGSPVKLGYDVEKNLIRIAQESVANAARHAHATLVRVTLEYGQRQVRLETFDDGAGMTLSDGKRGHFGIAGMRERAKLMGGKFDLRSAPEHGTEVEVVIPARGGA